jgi:Flp pilus assembly protein TadG
MCERAGTTHDRVERDAGGRRPDRGQVVPLVAVVLLVVAGVAVAIVAVGGVLLDRASARTAADAAALAAAAADDAEAHDVAAANGAEVVEITRIGDQVEVEVSVGRATARARATVVREVVPPEPPPRGVRG